MGLMHLWEETQFSSSGQCCNGGSGDSRPSHRTSRRNDDDPTSHPRAACRKGTASQRGQTRVRQVNASEFSNRRAGSGGPE